MTDREIHDAPRSHGPAESDEPERAPDDLAVTLSEVVCAAQRTFPTLSVPRDVFVAYLRERLPTGVAEQVALRQVHTADLYLACGCAHGDARALAAFDDHCLRQLDRVLGKMGVGPDVCADIKQDIRTRVLLGVDGEPEIKKFVGRGDLRGWVRVMAVRRVLQWRHRTRREVPVADDELLQRVVASGAPELDQTKQKYHQEFKRAFDAALQTLPDRERNLLRQHHVDGLTIDELGTLYRVHRSTAARLLSRARLLVLEATRTRMMAQLGIATRDLDSIIRMIRSQIHISLRGLRRRRRR